MKKTLSKYYILALIAIVISGNLQAQKYTLTYTSQDDTLDPSIQKGIEKIVKKVMHIRERSLLVQLGFIKNPKILI